MTRLSRRRVLIGGMTLMATAATAPKLAVADPVSAVEAQIAALEIQHGALIGVYASNLDLQRTV
ncbi:class A beta-lactamase, partial [Mycolicibacterium elephantis]